MCRVAGFVQILNRALSRKVIRCYISFYSLETVDRFKKNVWHTVRLLKSCSRVANVLRNKLKINQYIQRRGSENIITQSIGKYKYWKYNFLVSYDTSSSRKGIGSQHLWGHVIPETLYSVVILDYRAVCDGWPAVQFYCAPDRTYSDFPLFNLEGFYMWTVAISINAFLFNAGATVSAQS